MVLGHEGSRLRVVKRLCIRCCCAPGLAKALCLACAKEEEWSWGKEVGVMGLCKTGISAKAEEKAKREECVQGTVGGKSVL